MTILREALRVNDASLPFIAEEGYWLAVWIRLQHLTKFLLKLETQ